MKLFTNGELHFVDGHTEKIKTCIVDTNVLIVSTNSGLYKLYMQKDTNELFEKDYNFLISKYPTYKWSEELQTWVSFKNFDYVICSP